MSGFRRRVMDALDACHEQTGGRTPDHIIVSESVYSGVRSEKLKERRPLSGEGFMGMTMWHSGALDERDKQALLLTDEVFDEHFNEFEVTEI